MIVAKHATKTLAALKLTVVATNVLINLDELVS